MSEPKRLEGWANVYLDKNRNEYFIGLWKNRTEAELHKAEDAQRIVRVTEIRDGESIAVNGETDGPPLVSGVDPASGKDGAVVVTMAPWSLVDDARKDRDAAIERAEKAEAEIERLAKDDQRYVPVKTLNEVQAMFDAEHKRAEKAECERAQMVQMLDVVREDVRGWMRRAMGESDRAERMDQQLRNANIAATVAGFQVDDAAAKFERETAAKLFAVEYAERRLLPHNTDLDKWWADRIAFIALRAAQLRSHYFPPAKEA